MIPVLLGTLLVANTAHLDVHHQATSINSYFEQRVREVFKDAPAMIDVAYCESTMRHYVGSTTEVLRGREVREDVGGFQINEKYHLETATKMGLNIYEPDGNIAYAKYLYEKNGLRDWSASHNCMNRRAKLRHELSSRQDLL